MDMKPSELEGIFARNLHARRLELDLTQADLAGLTGLPQPHISALERGSMAPTLATIAKLAESLDTTPSALLSTVTHAPLSPSGNFRENLSASA
jgi:transcriptional regulator with XRE-family HTH domain